MSPEDLAGVLLAEEPGRWSVINIPAVAEAGVPDALHRDPGVAMVSALGRTAESFAEIKRRQRTYHLDVPGMRSDRLRAATQHALHDTRWASDRANLQHDLDPDGWRADSSGTSLVRVCRPDQF